MPRKKTSSRTRIEKVDTLSVEPQIVESSTTMPPTRSSWKRNLLIIALVILALLAFKFKNLFVVATVNGSPITRLELEKELNNKYADQTLENMISEQVILSEARKKGISISDADVNTKIKEIEDRLKGQISLEDALKAQGLTKDSFRKQVEIQLIIDKMFDKEAKVSDKEVEEYITQNQESLQTSTDPAKLRADVYNNLRQQKIGEIFDKWFNEAKQKASIVKF